MHWPTGRSSPCTAHCAPFLVLLRLSIAECARQCVSAPDSSRGSLAQVGCKISPNLWQLIGPCGCWRVQLDCCYRPRESGSRQPQRAAHPYTAAIYYYSLIYYSLTSTELGYRDRGLTRINQADSLRSRLICCHQSHMGKSLHYRFLSGGMQRRQSIGVVKPTSVGHFWQVLSESFYERIARPYPLHNIPS